MNAPNGTGQLLRRLLLRSLLIQAAWNYRGMQHLGFLWAVLPALPREDSARRAALMRACEFYNAHPYLGGYLLGATARLEAEDQGPALARLKRAAIPPLGAVGDRLFWAGLRPLCGALSILALILAASASSRVSIGVPVAIGVALTAAALYNYVHLTWRWRALRDGHRLGLGLAASIRDLSAHPGLARLGVALAILAGLLLPIAFGAALASVDGPFPAAGLFGLVVLLSWQLPARGWALPAGLLALAAAWML